MMKPIAGLPDDILGFEASGMVSARDYESVLMPAVEAVFSRRGKVRLVYQLGQDFSGFEAGAIWGDARFGFKHLHGWGRVAVVTGVEWVKTAVAVFRRLMPGQVRVFANHELAEARQWITA